MKHFSFFIDLYSVFNNTYKFLKVSNNKEKLKILNNIHQIIQTPNKSNKKYKIFI